MAVLNLDSGVFVGAEHAIEMQLITFLYLGIAGFVLPDHNGRLFDSLDCDKPVMVVVFLGTECPLARLYAGRLNEMAERFNEAQFIIVDSNNQDSTLDIAQFVAEYHLEIPVLKDHDGLVAEQFGATRTPEAIVLDNDRVIRYRGRIDDQYVPGARRPQASKEYVVDAIAALLAGKPIEVAQTEPVGCLIGRRQTSKCSKVTYNDVAPILYQYCVRCHRRGEIGPFPMTSYAETVSWGSTIREVIDQNRMPPWGADPKHGNFANDCSLPAEARQRIFAWLDAGSPEGNPHDCPSIPDFDSQARFSGPSFKMPESFVLPATGILALQEYVIDPEFTDDTWVQGVDIRPGNRAVVHHATVYLKPKGSRQIGMPGDVESFYLAMYVPGQNATTWPPGMAKRIPAGWEFLLQIHYVTIGTVQRDQTSFTLDVVDVASVQNEVGTKILMDLDLVIPPNEPHHVVMKSFQLAKDFELIALFPHMHLRGKSMMFEAFYPDGAEEVLLNVPKYDFMWQHRYVLKSRKALPAGTIIRCTGVFDNSAGNPSNPDPNSEVRYGDLTTDEMFHGHFEFCTSKRDRNPFDVLRENRIRYQQWLIAGLLAFLVLNRALGFKWKSYTRLPVDPNAA